MASTAARSTSPPACRRRARAGPVEVKATVAAAWAGKSAGSNRMVATPRSWSRLATASACESPARVRMMITVRPSWATAAWGHERSGARRCAAPPEETRTGNRPTQVLEVGIRPATAADVADLAGLVVFRRPLGPSTAGDQLQNVVREFFPEGLDLFDVGLDDDVGILGLHRSFLSSWPRPRWRTSWCHHREGHLHRPCAHLTRP